MAEGRFTIDSRKAWTKLRDFGLKDPREYVLLLVEAAVIAMPERPAIELELGQRTRAEFVGPTFEPRVFRNLLATVFDADTRIDPRTRVLQTLALAANAAYGAGAERVLIEHVDAQGRLHELEISPDGSTSDVQRDPSDAPRGWMRFTFEGPMLGAGARARHERDLLLERCRFARADIRMNGALLDTGPDRLLETDARVPVRDAEGELLGYAGYDPRVQTRVYEVVRGVLRETWLPEGEVEPGFVAVMYSDAQMDLSRGRIIRDASVEAERDDALQAAHDALPWDQYERDELETQHQAEASRMTTIFTLMLVCAPLALVVMLSQDQLPWVAASATVFISLCVIIGLGLTNGAAEGD